MLRFQLILLQKELTTGEKHCISSAVFVRTSLFPLAACIALLVRLMLRSVLSWQRVTTRVDEYGFVLESKGHCVYIDTSEQLIFDTLALFLLCGYLLYIYIQIIRAYQSMDMLLRKSKANLMKQSKQVIQCIIFNSLTLWIWVVSRMIGYGNQEYATSRIIVSVMNSTSVYLFIVFPALMCTWSHNNQSDSNEISEGINVSDRVSDISSMTSGSEVHPTIIFDRALDFDSTSHSSSMCLGSFLSWLYQDSIDNARQRVSPC